MLDFRIETFLQVCKHMNFTKASEELNITQPAVSQHIKYLENYYNTKLFTHEGKKLILTEEGRILHSVSITMINDENNMRKQFLNMSNALSELRFGATRTIGEVMVSDILSDYLRRYPDTHVYMKASNTKELLKSLENGDIDFALVEGYFRKSEYDYLHYSREKFRAVCSPFYKWDKKPETIEDLFNERLLIRENGSGTREILERYLESYNYNVKNFSNKAEIGSIHTIIELAKSGCGITFLYEAAVKDEIQNGNLIPIKIKDFNVEHDFAFIWRKGSTYSDVYKTFFERFQNVNKVSITGV